MIDFLSTLRQLVVYTSFITGIYFLVSTAVGMIRFPDLHTRLHAGSKCLMAGVIFVLMGCIVQEESVFVSLKLVVLLFFLLITNPIAIHVIGRFSVHVHFLSKTPVKNDINK
ncbi:monovalent cation/H(+) antiporter subunit G [Metabacillus sp. HB246100]|uniref:monovalent cation/H(+) antiporter subunit G n=1 Tax=Bacillus weihaiensis TaxID=1547283 RepID=UPI00235281AF|nr:monovalent cation/H(+) antiporter subunit G [Bacillus weihaiensis]